MIPKASPMIRTKNVHVSQANSSVIANARNEIQAMHKNPKAVFKRPDSGKLRQSLLISKAGPAGVTKIWKINQIQIHPGESSDKPGNGRRQKGNGHPWAGIHPPFPNFEARLEIFSVHIYTPSLGYSG
jgi:hypothetical protein